MIVKLKAANFNVIIRAIIMSAVAKERFILIIDFFYVMFIKVTINFAFKMVITVKDCALIIRQTTSNQNLLFYGEISL